LNWELCVDWETFIFHDILLFPSFPFQSEGVAGTKSFLRGAQKLAFVPAEWVGYYCGFSNVPRAIRRPTKSIVFVFHVYTSESTVLNFLNI
jgi:hypothetical protein